MSKSSWQIHKERSTPIALYSIRWIALHLSRPIARVFLYPITLYFLIFARAQRKASLQFLSRVYDHKPGLLDVARHIHCFASTILDRVYLMTGDFGKLDITFPAENMPLKYSQQGTGCILLGSHIGSFEVLRSYAVRKCPLPIKILMYEGQNPMIVQVLNTLNPTLSNMIIPIGDPDSLLQVRDAVDAGSAVGMLGDRVMDSKNEKTVQCTLLGGTVSLPAAPIIIAASLKVPVIVFFGIFKGGNKYELYFELLAERIDLNRKNRQQDIQFWMQQYANILEKHIRKAPYNWFNFYDYWLEDLIKPSVEPSQKIDQKGIKQLIPHAGKMCLIESVVFWDTNSIRCISKTHLEPDNPLRLDGKLSSIHLLEYGAQAIAIHGGLLRKSANAGYLAAVRNAKFSIDSLDSISSELIIKASADIKTESGAIYQFSITDTDNIILLEARATVINN